MLLVEVVRVVGGKGEVGKVLGSDGSCTRK
jgi:hypothetical protein